MTMMRLLLTALISAGVAAAQASSESADPAPDGTTAAMPLKQWDDNHILGIVPNYATVDEPQKTYEPLTVEGKLLIATHDSFDPFNWAITGLYAAVYQKENEYAFGQGAAGYAQRYAVTFADASISTYFSEGLFPVMLHEDPRFFRLGEGTKWHRIGYALTRVLVTRTDTGAWRFNNSEIEGNLLAAGISNFYYPPVNRGVGITFVKFGIGVVSDAGFNVLKEFWPDMRQKVFGR
jgi:hypothetical protein